MANVTPRGLHHFHFRPVDCGPGEAFAKWRDALGEILEVRATPTEIAEFTGDLEFAASQQFALSRSNHTPLSIVRSPSSGAQDQFGIHLGISGVAAGIAGNSEVRVEAGDLMFIDLAQSLTARLGADGGPIASCTIWTPRSRVLAAVSHENALHGLVLRGATPMGATLGATMRALVAAAPTMATGEFDALVDGFIAMAMKCVAPILDRLGDPTAASPLASYVTVRRYIDRNLTSPSLSPETIAKAFGLSRASLYRLFEPAGGIATYIRKARLNRAYQEITAPNLSNRRIGQIAFRLGFKNVSAFSRLFHEVYGMTPGDARERARRGVADATFVVPAKPADSLTRSLDGLAA